MEVVNGFITEGVNVRVVVLPESGEPPKSIQFHLGAKTHGGAQDSIQVVITILPDHMVRIISFIKKHSINIKWKYFWRIESFSPYSNSKDRSSSSSLTSMALSSINNNNDNRSNLSVINKRIFQSCMMVKIPGRYENSAHFIEVDVKLNDLAKEIIHQVFLQSLFYISI